MEDRAHKTVNLLRAVATNLAYSLLITVADKTDHAMRERYAESEGSLLPQSHLRRYEHPAEIHRV